MKRPYKYEASDLPPTKGVFKAIDIDPLLDRLEELEAQPHLKNRADGVDGHYSIGRKTPEGYYEFWDDIRKQWGSAGTVIKLKKYPVTTSDPIITMDDYVRAVPNNPAPNFPTLEEFKTWMGKYHVFTYVIEAIYNYFAQFQYETKVFPKVGDMVEGEDDSSIYWGKFKWIELDNGYVICNNIRPVTRPTREEVIAKYGITDEELEILTQTEQQ